MAAAARARSACLLVRLGPMIVTDQSVKAERFVMRNARRFGAVGLLLAPVFCGAAQADVTIAVVGPISGRFALLGEQVRRGVEVAVKDLNAQGGILNQKVTVVVGDDACEPGLATKVAKDLAAKKVKFVVGHLCSNASMRAAAIYAANDVLMISPVSTNPALTDDASKRGWKNIFRVSGRDDAQGVVAGRFLARSLKGQKVAILHDGSSYGKGLAVAARKGLRAAGARETMFEAYAAGGKTFAALISKMKEAGVSAVYIGGNHTDAGTMIRQAHEQGFKPKLFSGDILVNQEFWTIAGPAGEGTQMTYLPDQRKNESAKAILGRFAQENYDPKGYTLYAYAAVQVWAEAARRAKSIETAVLSKAIRQMSFTTVIGKLSFDRKGDVRNPDYVWYIWKNGRYQER